MSLCKEEDNKHCQSFSETCAHSPTPCKLFPREYQNWLACHSLHKWEEVHIFLKGRWPPAICSKWSSSLYHLSFYLEGSCWIKYKHEETNDCLKKVILNGNNNDDVVKMIRINTEKLPGGNTEGKTYYQDCIN